MFNLFAISLLERLHGKKLAAIHRQNAHAVHDFDMFNLAIDMSDVQTSSDHDSSLA